MITHCNHSTSPYWHKLHKCDKCQISTACPLPHLSRGSKWTELILKGGVVCKTLQTTDCSEKMVWSSAFLCKISQTPFFFQQSFVLLPFLKQNVSLLWQTATYRESRKPSLFLTAVILLCTCIGIVFVINCHFIQNLNHIFYGTLVDSCCFTYMF